MLICFRNMNYPVLNVINILKMRGSYKKRAEKLINPKKRYIFHSTSKYYILLSKTKILNHISSISNVFFVF